MAVHYAEQLQRHARRAPDALAMVDHGVETTYGELRDRVDRIAAAFTRLGVSPGDRVAMIVDNGAVPYEVMLACARAGFAYVPTDFRLAAHDLAAIIADCEPSIIVVDSVYHPVAEQVRLGMSPGPIWVSTSDQPAAPYLSYGDLVHSEPPSFTPIDVTDGDLFCILYTSGTTGRAKGVTFNHAQVHDNAISLVVICGLDSQSRYLVSYPHNSAGTVNHVWGPTLLAGGALVMESVKEFAAQSYFKCVERYRVTHSQLVPTMLFRLLDFPDRKRFDYSSLRCLGYASAPIPPARVREALDVFGPIITQLYGMTETCSHAAILTQGDHSLALDGQEELLSSCGRPVPGVELKILGEDGVELPRGEIGEIAMRGRWLTSGYWRDPERTVESIRDGWLFSGDMARVDDRDYVYIMDRKKDLIITGGANVASTEVESVLSTHPAVAEAAVIGVADDQWGERVHAVVVPRVDSSPSVEELLEYCRERLSRYKCPKTLDVVEGLPYTSTGKVAKAELRSRFAGG